MFGETSVGDVGAIVYDFLDWKTPNGCATCRLAINYYMVSTWFVVARVLHCMLYTFNFATLRSLVWAGSLVCILMLFRAGGVF